MTGSPSASPRPDATSLPSEPISRVMAMIGIPPPPEAEKLAVQFGQCTPFAVAGVAGAPAALRHPHRAVLELRDLAEGVEGRVGEQVRRRLVVREGDEHRAARGARVRPGVERDLAAARFDGDDLTR